MKNRFSKAMALFLSTSMILSSAAPVYADDAGVIAASAASDVNGTEAVNPEQIDTGMESDPEESSDVLCEELPSSGECGEQLAWELDDQGKLTISGTGDMADYKADLTADSENGEETEAENDSEKEYSARPWEKALADISEVVVEDGVTSIGSYAFADCENLEKISISADAKTIGQGAFSDCIKITDFTVPENVTCIQENTFKGCTELEEVTIPVNVTEIEKSVFENCTSLKKVLYMGNKEQWAKVTIGENNGEITEDVLSFVEAEDLKNINNDKNAKAESDNDEDLSSVSEDTSDEDIVHDSEKLQSSASEDTDADDISDQAGEKSENSLTADLQDEIEEKIDEALEDNNSLNSDSENEENNDSDNVLTIQVDDTTITLANNESETDVQEAVSDVVMLLSASDENTQVYDTMEEAADYVTQQMKLKTEYINVSFKVSKEEHDATDPYSDELYELVTRESNGDPLAGSALLEFSMSGSCHHDEYDDYYVEHITYHFPNYLTSYAQDQELEQAERNLVSQMNLEGKSDYEKASVLYDWVCTNVDYDDDNLSKYTNGEDYDIGAWSAYNAFFKGKAVCAGFASLYYQLLLIAGVDNACVCGSSHMWNLVGIDGLYYYCDPTWDGSTEVNYRNCFLKGSKSFFDNGFVLHTEYKSDVFCNRYPASLNDYGESTDTDTIEGTVDNINWNIQNGVLTISGEGTMPDFVSSGAPWSVYSDSIQKVVIEDGLTSISSYAFSTLKVADQYSLPSSLRTIEYKAFYENESLESIILPDTIEVIDQFAFYGCKNLSEIQLPENLKTIEEWAFYNCEALTEIDIPKNVTSIGDYAFEYCISLTSVIFPNSLKQLGSCTFYNCTALETADLVNTQITTLPGNLFLGCSNLSGDVYLPKTITEVRSSAFESTSVKRIIFTGNMPSFEPYSLYSAYKTFLIGCYPEENPTWDIDSVRTIASEWIALSAEEIGHIHIEEVRNKVLPSKDVAGYTGDVYCTICGELIKSGGTEEYEILDSGEYGNGVFWSIDNAETLNIYGQGAMEYSSSLLALWTSQSITTINIEEGITSIPSFAFSDMGTVSYVNFPNTLKDIDTQAFQLTGIKELSIPDSVTYIGSACFQWCKKLSTVKLSSNMTSISDCTFLDCTALESLEIPDNVSYLGASFAENCSNLGEITVSENNKYFKLLDGMIYDYEINKLVFCPMTKAGIVTVYDGVTDIGNAAFACCKLIEKIVLPESVRTIEPGAFSDCTGLETINLPDGLEQILASAFNGCTNLQNISIPATVTNIGDRAFENCSSLKEVVIPEGITTIREQTFDSCKSLELVILPASLKNIDTKSFFIYKGKVSFKTRLIFKGDFPTITSDAFMWSSVILYYPEENSTWTDQVMTDYKAIYDQYAANPSIKTTLEWKCYAANDYEDIIHIWDEGETIIEATEESAGQKIYTCTICGKTKTEEIPSLSESSDITGVCGESLFYILDETGLLTIVGTGDMYDYNDTDNRAPWFTSDMEIEDIYKVIIQSGVTSIGDYAFYNTDIWSVELPDTLTSIGNHSFQAMCSLYDIQIPNQVKSIGDFAFDGCAALDGVVIPDSVKSIGKYAFCNCGGLESVKLPKGLKNIETEMFSGDMELNTIEIPDTVTSIKNFAFCDCSNITELTLPENLTSIGDYAFASCTGLKSITIPGVLESIGQEIFKYDNSDELICYGHPDTLLETYCNDNGIEFSSLGHTWDEGTITRKPSSKESGLKTFICTVCGTSKTEEIDPVPAAITSQPETVRAAIGKQASFSVFAENAASYQWQYSKDGTKWYNSTSSGARTDTLTITVKTANYKNQYRCKVAWSTGEVIYSETVSVDLIPGAVITAQPKSVCAVKGETVTFTAEAENAADWQWYYSKDGGTNWFKSTADGSGTASLQITTGTNNSGNQYRCKITGTDGNTMTSTAAGLILIDAQPEDSTAAVGTTCSFTVKTGANSNVVSYKWYYSKDGGNSWYASTAGGYDTDTISFKAASTNRSNLYRCKLTDSNGVTAYTKTAGFSDIAGSGVRITEQPVSVTASVGETVSFKVTAENAAAADGYQWYYSKDGKNWYKSTAAGSTTDTLTISVKTSNQKNQYRCKITGTDGTTVTSDAVSVQ